MALLEHTDLEWTRTMATGTVGGYACARQMHGLEMTGAALARRRPHNRTNRSIGKAKQSNE